MELKLTQKNMPNVQQFMKGFEREIPFTTALALTRTSKAVEPDLINRMKKVLDRPKPYTLNSLFTRPATKRKLQSSVGIKDFAPKGTPAVKYLQALVEGGKRRHKRSERALAARGKLKASQYLVPGKDAKLNKYGNLPAAQVVKALSNVRGQQDRYQDTTEKSAARNVRRGGRQYFWLPGQGIYYRQGKTLKSFLVLAKAPTYRRQFDFYGDGAKSANRHLPEQMTKAMTEVMRQVSAKSRSGSS